MCTCWKWVGGRVQTAICISAVIVGKSKQNHVGLLPVRRPLGYAAAKIEAPIGHVYEIAPGCQIGQNEIYILLVCVMKISQKH